MNVTISIDDALVARARDLARRRGTSLQDMIRGYLESLVGARSNDALADELAGLLGGGASGGAAISRDDAYRERLS